MAAVTTGASGPVGLTLDAESQNLAGEAVAVEAPIVQATKAKARVHGNVAVALGIAGGTLGQSCGSPFTIPSGDILSKPSASDQF
jgi:hypothetical protein